MVLKVSLFFISYDCAGEHLHPAVRRGGDSRHAGGLQAWQRGQPRSSVSHPSLH
jgi:hypothetical protein